MYRFDTSWARLDLGEWTRHHPVRAFVWAPLAVAVTLFLLYMLDHHPEESVAFKAIVAAGLGIVTVIVLLAIRLFAKTPPPPGVPGDRSLPG
jgi:predicted MFS family arabinose efflux permease